MQLKLKEDAREWQKFMLAAMAALNLALFLAYRRHLVAPSSLQIVLTISAMVLVACLLRPHWFRSPYRMAMTASFHVGHIMGKVLLTLLFFLVVTPMGLLLRLAGKDLLRLKKDPKATSYWQSVKPNSHFDRPF